MEITEENIIGLTISQKNFSILAKNLLLEIKISSDKKGIIIDLFSENPDEEYESIDSYTIWFDEI